MEKTSEEKKELWFKRKTYGWGWTPVTWQGWLLTLVYVASIIKASFRINNSSPLREVLGEFILPVAGLTFLFTWIAYKKGETPRWQWGKHK